MVAVFLRAAGIALWVQLLVVLRAAAIQNLELTVVREGPTAMTRCLIQYTVAQYAEVGVG